ncbi:hypothetical protein AAMO2058_001108700 [Amorphochlora amoebiformis]
MVARRPANARKYYEDELWNKHVDPEYRLDRKPPKPTYGILPPIFDLSEEMEHKKEEAVRKMLVKKGVDEEDIPSREEAMGEIAKRTIETLKNDIPRPWDPPE